MKISYHIRRRQCMLCKKLCRSSGFDLNNIENTKDIGKQYEVLGFDMQSYRFKTALNWEDNENDNYVVKIITW